MQLSLQGALTWGGGCGHGWGPKRAGLTSLKESSAKRGLSPPWERGDPPCRKPQAKMEHPPPFDLGLETRPACLSAGQGWEGRGGQSTLSLFQSIPVLGMGRGSFK